jgi:hypothetical protein
MDETSWKVIGNHAYRVSMPGIEGIKISFSRDPKMCLTPIVSISRTGDQLLILAIAKNSGQA